MHIGTIGHWYGTVIYCYICIMPVAMRKTECMSWYLDIENYKEGLLIIYTTEIFSDIIAFIKCYDWNVSRLKKLFNIWSDHGPLFFTWKGIKIKLIFFGEYQDI